MKEYNCGNKLYDEEMQEFISFSKENPLDEQTLSDNVVSYLIKNKSSFSNINLLSDILESDDLASVKKNIIDEYIVCVSYNLDEDNKARIFLSSKKEKGIDFIIEFSKNSIYPLAILGFNHGNNGFYCEKHSDWEQGLDLYGMQYFYRNVQKTIVLDGEASILNTCYTQGTYFAEDFKDDNHVMREDYTDYSYLGCGKGVCGDIEDPLVADAINEFDSLLIQMFSQGSHRNGFARTRNIVNK